MRMVVKQKDGNTKEFHFTEGPVSIGRGADSQVFLPDKAVSRKHAIVHVAEDGTWMLEDLGSGGRVTGFRRCQRGPPTMVGSYRYRARAGAEFPRAPDNWVG